MVLNVAAASTAFLCLDHPIVIKAMAMMLRSGCSKEVNRAAHRKFPFGTKLKITNEVNHKSVIVQVTDRGPFVKGREIDLTKKAFMDIVDNKNSGKVMVTIEEIIPTIAPKP